MEVNGKLILIFRVKLDISGCPTGNSINRKLIRIGKIKCTWIWTFFIRLHHYVHIRTKHVSNRRIWIRNKK